MATNWQKPAQSTTLHLPGILSGFTSSARSWSFGKRRETCEFQRSGFFVWGAAAAAAAAGGLSKKMPRICGSKYTYMIYKISVLRPFLYAYHMCKSPLIHWLTISLTRALYLSCLKGLRIAKIKINMFWLPPKLSECNQWGTWPSLDQCFLVAFAKFGREPKNINFNFCYAQAL